MGQAKKRVEQKAFVPKDLKRAAQHIDLLEHGLEQDSDRYKDRLRRRGGAKVKTGGSVGQCH